MKTRTKIYLLMAGMILTAALALTAAGAFQITGTLPNFSDSIRYTYFFLVVRILLSFQKGYVGPQNARCA